MSRPEIHDAEHFRSYVPREGGVLERLEKEATEKDIPIIGPVLGRLLSIMARAIGARRVLELGTATGYSAIQLARAVAPIGGKVTTVELDHELAEVARNNIAEAGFSEVVKVIEGDANEVMETLEGPFDMVFNDVEKEFYPSLLDPTVKVLGPGGLMLLDNTAFKSAGDLLERAFRHPELETVHLYGFFPQHSPDFDAITICVKR